MKQTDLDAIEQLEAANPFRGEIPVPEWTTEDEVALLARVLEEQRASSESTDGSERTMSRSAAPRTKAERFRRPALLVTATCAAGAVAFGIALGTSGSPGAFGAWTATTTEPPAAQLAAATSGCQSFYRHATVLLPNASSAVSPALTTPLRLTDSRGPFEMLVYSGPSGGDVCLWDGAVLSVTGGTNGDALPAGTESSVGVPAVGFVRDRQTPVTYAYGNVGTQVTAVTLELTNGDQVEATVQNGLYGAWWPSQTDVESATVISTNGPSHQDFGDIGPNNQAPPEN